MHTTYKTILDLPEVDIHDRFEKGTKEVRIIASNKKTEEKRLVAIHSIDKKGKIISSARPNIKTGWTAYPPNTNMKEEENEEKYELSLMDKFIYSPLGNLTKIESFDTKEDKKISTKHFEYEKGKIVREKIIDDEIIYTRKEKGQIVGIIQKKATNNISETTIKTGFVFNKENHIAEKTTELNTKTGEMNFGIIMIESFEYNMMNQLEVSVSSIKLAEETENIRKEFDYLNNEDDLISSIKYYREGKRTKKIDFSYDTKNRLIKKVEVSSNDEKQIIEYQYY